MKKSRVRKVAVDNKQRKISLFCVKVKQTEPEPVKAQHNNIDDDCQIVEEIVKQKSTTSSNSVGKSRTPTKKRSTSNEEGGKRKKLFQDTNAISGLVKSGTKFLPQNLKSPGKHLSIKSSKQDQHKSREKNVNSPIKILQSPDIFSCTPEPKSETSRKKLNFNNVHTESNTVVNESDDVLDSMLDLINNQSSFVKMPVKQKASNNSKRSDKLSDEVVDAYCAKIDSTFIENTPPLTQCTQKDVLEVPKKARGKESKSDDENQFLTKTNTNVGPLNCLKEKNINVSLAENECKDLIGDLFDKDFMSPVKLSQEDNKTDLADQLPPSWYQSQSIDLTLFSKCVITNILKDDKKWELYLKLVCCKMGTNGSCLLKGMWASATLNINDVIAIHARKTNLGWVVDNTGGLVCLFPDTLISSTSLVNARFCRRRGILSDLFRGQDSDNKMMILGKIIHELLQECLELNLRDDAEIKEALQKILLSHNTVKDLYSSNMTLHEVELELNSYILQIKNFIATYVTRERQTCNGNFEGSISEIVDIEENIWAPKFGVKGRIDVTVKIKSNNQTKIMPLELKTGRASFSHEHRGQVILYVMMMSEMGEKVDSGLLLYLKEGILKEVRPTFTEKRDLVLLRNDLVQYLVKSDASDEKSFGVPRLPEPISFEAGCQKCPYLTICSTLLQADNTQQLSNNHPMKNLSFLALDHLKQEDIDYFLHWCGLLYLEESELENDVQSIWCVPPEEREKKRECICGLELAEVNETKDGFYHIFTKKKGENITLGLSVGDFVIISTDLKHNICCGPIIDITPQKITISLDKNLKKRYLSQIFHIDKYKSGKMNSSYLSNLGCLIDNQDNINHLRNIIVSKPKPTFQTKLSKSILDSGMGVLADLNEHQQRAILKAMASDSYILIKGMPGCGKTQTVAALIRFLLACNKTILITSHTHSAIDNILLRLNQYGIEYLRLGALNRIHKDVIHRSESVLNKTKTPDELRDFYNSFKVVAATCLGVNHVLFSQRRFDYCVVDESTQVLQPEILKPLFHCNKFVLMGDPNQLPPVVKNKKAKSLGMDISLFSVLDCQESTVVLSYQYRMNETIMKLANKLTYNNELICGNDTIKSAVLNVNPNIKLPDWLCKVLSNKMEDSIVFIDTCNSERVETGCSNIFEATLIKCIIDKFRDLNFDLGDLGVTAPYRDQVELLSKSINSEAVEVNTVDQYQGRDKQVIIYSCTKNNRSTKVDEQEILNDKRRLTVAITRARLKLVLVGDSLTLINYKPFRELMECLKESQIVRLDSFDWDLIKC